MKQRNSSFFELLTDKHLLALKSYKYQSVDKSYVSKYILNPYWNFISNFMPLWVAPNTITLLGLIAILINLVFIAFFIPDLIGPGPSWLYFSFSAGVWIYSTLDNIDGKQARKTNTSSPLGELFDHGIDSLNCTLASLLQACALGLGSTPLAAYLVLMSCVGMYLSTWETYHTHVLYLGVINGPTEGIILVCLSMILSGIYGSGFWTGYTISNIISIQCLPEFLNNVTLAQIWVHTITFGLIFFHFPACMKNVYYACKKENKSFAGAIMELVPLIVTVIAQYLWLSSPHSTILNHNHLMLFGITYSFVFGRITTKIILYHLTKQEFPYWTILVLPLVVGALLFNILPLYFNIQLLKNETAYLWGYLIFSSSYFLLWANYVSKKICNFLEISCFRVPKRSKNKAI